jgi:SPX domain protein involved in polyphosphate accumulation
METKVKANGYDTQNYVYLNIQNLKKRLNNNKEFYPTWNENDSKNIILKKLFNVNKDYYFDDKKVCVLILFLFN